MNNKAFTLIELLAVITILSIIILVVSISVSNVLKDTKQDLSKSQIEAIKSAANSWSADNLDIMPANNNCSFITLKDLKDDGLIDNEIIDPKNKKEISNDLVIKITSKPSNNSNSNLIYEVNPDSLLNCTYIGSNLYVDLPKGLTPIIYDGDNWKVPEEDEEWYNYGKQQWANAVVLGKGKNKRPGEVVTVEGENPDALMMLVYIPRYEYKIDGQYGTHTNGTPGTAETPGEIEVKFVNNNQTEADSDYILHPAFDFGGEQLHGIWVGKFELSHETLSSSTTDNNLGCSSTNCTNASGLRILPNISSLRYNNVSNFWYGIKSIENTEMFGLSHVDTHMIKNNEWGAVAYLSQSKYGKYGNSDYEGVQKEVYINNSSSFYTGRSGGNPGGNTKIKDTYTDQTDTTLYTNYGYYTYDGYLLSYNTNNKTETRDINKGAGASTTGNIYGVYDMSGGAWEYVMGAYGDNQGIYSGQSSSLNSGFNGRTGSDNGNVTNGAQVPDSKYYDVYTNSTNSDSNDGISYGHAISETASWYGDSAYMVASISPWFVRGGSYNNSAAAGVFDRDSSTGYGDFDYSARVVCFVK